MTALWCVTKCFSCLEISAVLNVKFPWSPSPAVCRTLGICPVYPSLWLPCHSEDPRALSTWADPSHPGGASSTHRAACPGNTWETAWQRNLPISDSCAFKTCMGGRFINQTLLWWGKSGIWWKCLLFYVIILYIFIICIPSFQGLLYPCSRWLTHVTENLKITFKHQHQSRIKNVISSVPF